MRQTGDVDGRDGAASPVGPALGQVRDQPGAGEPAAGPRRLFARLDRLLTWKRARTYALVLVGLYVVAWLQVLAAGRPPLNSSGVPIGGDYIAFHAAARLLATGHGPRLYDYQALSAVQDELLGGSIPNFYDAYRNPPFYALLYVPFAALELLPAFAAYSLVSVAALGLAVRLALREVTGLRARWRGLLVLVFAFPPVYFGLIDGENATLSLLVYVLMFRALSRGQHGTAGAWAALGLFKPQVFVVFPLVFVARRQWRALAAYALTALALAAASVLLVGVDGMHAWLRILLDMERGNAEVNAWRMVSLKSFFETLLPSHAALAFGLYVGACGVLLTALVRLWSRRHVSLPRAWIFTCLAAVLVDPHLIDYDLTVLLPAGIFAAIDIPPLRGWIVLAYLVTLLRLDLPLGDSATQLSVVVLAACAWYAWRANTAQARAYPAPRAFAQVQL